MDRKNWFLDYNARWARAARHTQATLCSRERGDLGTGNQDCGSVENKAEGQRGHEIIYDKRA
jgi:hypothetical protein